jgi:hypothetical protein
MAQELNLLGWVSFVARLVFGQDLLDDGEFFFLAGHLGQKAQGPGHGLRGAQVALDCRQGRAALGRDGIEDPLLLLLVLNGLVVHHAEPAQQAVEGCLGAFVGQPFHGLIALGRLQVLVRRALDEVRQRALLALLLGEEVH